MVRSRTATRFNSTSRELSAFPERRLVGRKIGLTSAVVQKQMGVSQPDFGLLFGEMAFGDQESVSYDRFLQPRVEAEVAFVLGDDLTELPVNIADVLRATDFVVPAIEIVDSRIANWDISIVDTVGDNASSGAFVLGGSPRSLRDIPDLRDCEMTLSCCGSELSAGTGAASLGHPANAVVWLANTVAYRGVPLRKGEIVLSGALGPIVGAEPGQEYEAKIAGLGSVRARTLHRNSRVGLRRRLCRPDFFSQGTYWAVMQQLAHGIRH